MLGINAGEFTRATRTSRRGFLTSALLTVGIATTALLAGCASGNNHVITPASSYAGTYNGTWQFTPTGSAAYGGNATIVVAGDGEVTGTFTDTTTGAHSFTAAATIDSSGNITPSSEAFAETKKTAVKPSSRVQIVGAATFSGKAVVSSTAKEITGTVSYDFPGSGNFDVFDTGTSPSPSPTPTVE